MSLLSAHRPSSYRPSSYRQVAFWAASCLIAFALSFVLGAVWQNRQAPPAAAVAYAGE